MNQSRRSLLLVAFMASISILDIGLANAHSSRRPEHFVIEERRVIVEYYHRDGKRKHKNLPPGLQKKLYKNGKLPPGLQKRALPVGLERRLPRLPKYQERVIVERHIILIDRRSNRILDIIEDVVDLIQDG